MFREPFINGEIYHVFNRGVEKRIVFMDDADRRRFWFCLMACNTDKPVINLSQRIANGDLEIPTRQEHLVHILAYCFMPNHYHLLLTQAVEGGIKRFMHKIGTAYTMYFNTHTERVGPLFQGVFKAVNIEKQEHLSYLPHYIHANALDLNSKFTGWRNGQISDTEKAIEYLWAYPWSSYPHYAGLINDLVIDEQSIVELFEDKKMIVDDMRDWFSDTAVNGLKLDPALILEGGGDMNAE